MQNYQKLTAKMARVCSLRDAGKILSWDANVLMPKDAASYRSDQLAAIAESALEIIKESDNLKLIAQAKNEKLSDLEKVNLHEIEFVINSANAVDTQLLVEHERAKLNTEILWREAKAQNNFKLVEKELTNLFNLTLKIAQAKAKKFGVSPYQAMINDFDRGFDEAKLDRIFNKILTDIPPLLAKARKRQYQKQDFFMKKSDQQKLAIELSKVFGFKGRVDESSHPFCGGNVYDVRLTTFYLEHDFIQAVMAVIHESGHALYNSNLPRHLINQPVGEARGMAMHESQSLFMEKQVGASQGFISWLAGFIKQQLPDYNFKAEYLNDEINTVEPSFIRVFADEMTYPLHVAIRYLIEKKLVNGEITIAQLPEVWDDMYEKYLGIRPAKQSEGCLQDIHWYIGAFGYFPSYTCGAIIASMLAKKLREIFPDFNQKLAKADLGEIMDWLKDNIHSKASTLSLKDLLISAVGNDLDYECYLDYLKNKFVE
jgi:carboxypeptidase Taq